MKGTDMDVTDELIERFFRNEASPGEVEAVQAYFDRYPEQMEKYASEMERFQTVDHLHPAMSRSIYKNIEGSLEDRRSVRMKVYRSLAVAASILILAGAAWWFIAGDTRHKAGVQQKVEPLAGQLKQLPPLFTRVMNTSDTIMHIALKDGSAVDLERQSGISYYEPFINHRRDISLTGAAVFNVAKDKSSSFTVYAGGIATTALGTKFKVNAAGLKNKVTVQLYEGSVVVKQVNGSAMNYLLPGQQLAFNSRTQSMTLAPIDDKDKRLMASDKKRITPVEKDRLVFKDRPFNEVIASLEKEFGVHIKVEGVDIKKINVTVEFKRTDPVLDMLNSIAMLNGLAVSQQGDTYIIK